MNSTIPIKFNLDISLTINGEPVTLSEQQRSKLVDLLECSSKEELSDNIDFEVPCRTIRVPDEGIFKIGDKVRRKHYIDLEIDDYIVVEVFPTDVTVVYRRGNAFCIGSKWNFANFLKSDLQKCSM